MKTFEIDLSQLKVPKQKLIAMIDSTNWLFALQDGLRQAGSSVALKEIHCDFLSPQDVTITLINTGQQFRIKELHAEESIALPLSQSNIPVKEKYNNQQTILDVKLPSSPELQKILAGGMASHALPTGVVTELEVQSPVHPNAISSNYSKEAPLSTNNLSTPAISPQVKLPPAPVVSTQPKPVSTPAVLPSSPSLPTGSMDVEMSDFLNPGGSTSKYAPGMTTEILADAFMRAMEVYDYGKDKKSAMKFILELGLNNINAIGGCIFLLDPNAAEPVLWTETALGADENMLCNFRIPLGQGMIGSCAEKGEHLLVSNALENELFQKDVLKESGISLSSIIVTPIQSNKSTLGVLFYYKSFGEISFSKGELSVCNYLAHVAGEYLGGILA